MSVADQVVQIFAATNGYLDRITVDKVGEFLNGLLQRAHSESADVLEKIAGGDWSDEIVAALEKVVGEFADDFGFDLDEEGQAIAAGESERVSKRDEPASSNGSPDGAAAEGGNDDDDEPAEREGEEETAAV